MLRSSGKKSLDLCGFQSAEPGKQGKDTFPLKIRVLLRNKRKNAEGSAHKPFHGIKAACRITVKKNGRRTAALLTRRFFVSLTNE